MKALLDGLGHPVAWGWLGQGTGLPRIVLNKVSGFEPVTTDGAAGFIVGRVQVDIYGTTPFEAGLLGRAVRELLSGYHGAMVRFARLEAIRDGQDGSDGDAIPRVSQDYAVKYRV
ncbi:hypothetical protein TG4357_03740 [Thalassovita gelatinovora]|uniref:Uncharacterized protein n=2 Tax=Thalassovita gelatinovora TaxID=53501 RepID=A0A0N7LWC2_THAGE|nr:hypothetical protein TG4357_03740 [Thalassovita gelatinovora]SEQ56766.1 hypothetical protein SAMN04488043_106201 [Thalassovita gelatinovora]